MAVRGVLRLSKRETKQLQKELPALLKRVQSVREAAGTSASRAKRGRYSLTIARRRGCHLAESMHAIFLQCSQGREHRHERSDHEESPWNCRVVPACRAVRD